jgi:hypothetical protein
MAKVVVNTAQERTDQPLNQQNANDSRHIARSIDFFVFTKHIRDSRPRSPNATEGAPVFFHEAGEHPSRRAQASERQDHRYRAADGRVYSERDVIFGLQYGHY